jgi:hypothetical protein
MVNVKLLLFPPLSQPTSPARLLGVCTSTCAVPAAGICVVVIVACNCVGLTTVVERGVPLSQITDDKTKLVPVTVSTTVACTSAKVALGGASAEMVGTGRALLQNGFSAEQLSRQKARSTTRIEETVLRMGKRFLSLRTIKQLYIEAGRTGTSSNGRNQSNQQSAPRRRRPEGQPSSGDDRRFREGKTWRR